MFEPNVTVSRSVKDGDEVKKGQKMGTVAGNIRVILSGGRTTLNYLQRMSGIATYTRSVAELLDVIKTKLLDTRKTTPNMRIFEKYAVRAGGGYNHRYNLSDGVLLKDNHIGAAGSVRKAVEMAREYFKVIGLEIYPVNTDEYAYLHKCGADYVTVFQETYNPDKYETLHLAGHKRIFPYRFYAQERALMGGMRGVGLSALLGLDDFRKDAFATGMHAYLLQKKYPHAEIAFSCPRLRPIINNDRINPMDVHERQLLQVICAYRLFMPFAGITVSSRECARVRDNLMQIAATKISAGVSTGIGEHGEEVQDKGDEQFEISDDRSVEEIYGALREHHLQPVMADAIYV